MDIFVAGVVGGLGVIMLLAGVGGHGSGLWTAITGQGVVPLNPNASPFRVPGTVSPPVDTGPPVGTGANPTTGGVPAGQVVPGLPPIPGIPYNVPPLNHPSGGTNTTLPHNTIPGLP